MDHNFFADLQQEFALPEKGILSRVLHKDEKVSVTLFGFAAGEELSVHSALTPAHSLGNIETVDVLPFHQLG